MPAQKIQLSLATDCSGMETPAMALQNLGVSVEHKFASDINKQAKATILANFPPAVFYDDLTERDNAKAAKADLYVAGFPCQPFSVSGLQQGFKDQAGRGNIFFKVLEYLKLKSPKVFVLENVKGLKQIDGGKYFEAIQRALKDLNTYNVYTEILNTRDHGVPQCRGRLYIVGIKKSCDKKTFTFPESLERVPIEGFLDKQKTKPTAADPYLPPKYKGTVTVSRRNVLLAHKAIKAKGHDPFTENWLVDCDSSTHRSQWMKDYSPCFTCRRAKGHWITSRGRRMNTTEMLRLHGMNTTAEGFVQAVSDVHLGIQLGNAMSCNVLERLFVRLLPAAGLAPAHRLHDRWVPRAAPGTPRRTLKRVRSDSPEKTPAAKRLRRTTSDPKSAK